MEKNSGLNRNVLKFKGKEKSLSPDLKAVSEAIGTILLLAISVSLVGVVAFWVQSFPEPKETIQATLSASIDPDEHIISIEHKGGDNIDTQQIEIYVKIDGVTKQIFKLVSATDSIFDDGYWSIGETWQKDITPLHNWLVSIPEIVIEVIDINSDSVILNERVQQSGDIGNRPDLKVAEEDISFEFLNTTLRNGEWVNITANIHNIGTANAVKVIVRFFDGSKLIAYNQMDYIFIPSIPAKSFTTINLNWTPIFFGLKTINVKVYSAHIEENYENNLASKELQVEPVLPIISGPNFEIEDIQFNPSTPRHGDWVTITVLVKNVGDDEVPPGTDVNLTLEDEKGYLLTKGVTYFFNITTTTNLTQFETLQPGFTYQSQTTYGGKTKIKAVIACSITEARYDDNYMDKYIQILPTILLVDDDSYFEIYSKDDASSYMDASLQLAVGSGQFDVYTVKSGDGPKYSTGDKQLRNYDIVIWMTGYQTSNTLTTSDQTAIKEYLEHSGKLWLIGMNVLEDLRIQAGFPPGMATNFVRNYLGVEDYQITGTPDFLYGIQGDNLTQGWELNTSNIVKAKDNGVNFTLRSSNMNRSINGILGNDLVLGKNGNMSLKYYNSTSNYTFKVVYFGWEFASIIDMINRNNVTTQILKWFDWELEIGTDLAISSKGFSIQNPKFMDWITITATVRNNGPRDLARVRVDFFIRDANGRETRIPEYPGYKDPENPSFKDFDNPQFPYIPGGGGEREVQKKWLAVTVGRLTFRVVVDLEDEIEEVSEENNDDFYSPLFVTQLVIGYTILIVDDDNSTNNGGIYYNASQDIADALDELGYIYDTFTVSGGLTPQPGPNITVMKHYNTVIWCTGYDENYTLLMGDQENLTNYFTRGFPEAPYLGETKMNTWIIGQDILDNLGGSGVGMTPATSSFLYEYLRVKQYSTVGSTLPSSLHGVYRDNITHGLNYPMIQAGSDKADIIIPTNNAYGIFWQDTDHTNYNALRYNTTVHNLVFTPWVFSLINDTTTAIFTDESFKSELCYLILRWFYYPDERFELKTSPIDIELSSYNPVLGETYILKSNIYNLGGNDTNAIVRFLDGKTVINTKSIFVPANGNSSTEVIWSPLYAGFRDLFISVDPEDDISEVFDLLNNNASLNHQPVYFFYDDMENGSSNWEHDSTIVLINGESPLGYMDNPVFSNVNGTWNNSLTNGFFSNTSTYHSYSSSFFTIEPYGIPGKRPLDIVLTLDTSASMGGQKIADLIVAAKNFINNTNLDSRDRVAIYSFVDEDPYREIDFTDCNPSGKAQLISIIEGLTATGYTPLWDSIGEGVSYAINNGSSSRVPIVISMTDGEDRGTGGREDGSETYCPWHNWSEGEKRYHEVDGSSGHDHYGCYGGDPSSEGSWQWENLADEYRYGLLNITNVTVYTVGLGLENDYELDNSSWRFSDGWMGEWARYEFPSTRNTSIYNESGTPEYNLWRVANTSGGDYFYANDSSQLDSIYQTVYKVIVYETTIHRSANQMDSKNRGSPRAQIFFDGLESGQFSPTWTVGGGWNVLPNYQHNGFYYADATGKYTDSTMTMSNDLDLSNYEDVRIVIWQYTYDTVEVQDDFYFEVSTNSGTSWTTVRAWDGDDLLDIYDEYHRYIIPLTAYDGSSLFRIRFRFTMNQKNRWWYIDDIEILGNVTAGGNGTMDPGLFAEGDRNLTTHPFSLNNVTEAKLSFYHKYNLRLGFNGVVVMVGTPDNTGINWNFEYAQPTQPYTQNYFIERTRYDDFDNEMRWCWNGVSGNGKYTWDYIEVDLTNWTGLDSVCIRIAFLWAGRGSGGGYFIDDLKVEVTRNESISSITASVDQWNLTTQHAHSGTHCWWNRDALTGNLSGGLDNSLYTRPIDLTNARNATLSAFLKFNINAESGRPPDGFRMEISSDNGVTWKAINMGVRTAWGLSGNESDASDGVSNDGKSYTGLDVYGQDNVKDNWVEASTLTRLNTDISGWAGEVIILRIRVVTASDDNPYYGDEHYDWDGAPFRGIMVDDVIIYGFSLLN